MHGAPPSWWWGALAWAGRYGRQPLSELLDMTLDDFAAYHEALRELVEAENEAGGGDAVTE